LHDNSTGGPRVDEPVAEIPASEPVARIRGITGTSGEILLILTGTVDVYLAEDLHACALDLLKAGGDVALDLSQVHSMDVCTMQILLALRGDLVSLGRKLSISAASVNAALSFRMAGLAAIFGVS